ncbi:unnamed protein product [[Candida] boidinii]|nr:unnamed protein product [[Candida] boidinii]GME92913.1 unnamed protein product [[Candida] boidinii]
MELNMLNLKLNKDLKNLDNLNLQLDQIKNNYEINKRKLIKNNNNNNNKKSDTDMIDINNEDEEDEEGEDDKKISENAKILKLRLYESIGVKFNKSNNEIIILNKKNNQTNILKVNNNEYSDYFISNFIWDRI